MDLSEQPGPAVAEPTTETRPGYDHGWCVILFNDEVHTFGEVILQVQKATGCSLEEAQRLTMTAHREGQATVFQGFRERCELVADILEEIDLGVRVERL